MSPGDYNAVANQLLVFNLGDVRVTHTITINQDVDCEENMIEVFFSNLTLEGSMPTISVIHPHALVTIDDTLEPECSK